MLEPLIKEEITTLIKGLIPDDEEPISNWILATGFWNDDGIWIDTETWKDS